MKRTIVILIFALLCSRAFASTGAGVRSVVFRTYQADTVDYLEKLKGDLHYYRGMKATGAVLTGTGAAFFVAGQGMFWASVALNQSGRRSYSPVARDPLWLAGLGGTVLSAIPFAFGIPLLKYGTKKVRQLKIEIKAKEKRLQ
ncbi:MAG: hypothetical protein JWO03_3388 [Bacteroidetes bacterium]|nr:hypothetical protein [Bacteroidota bacterium]